MFANHRARQLQTVANMALTRVLPLILI
ncbi:uncharacterized protein METZ01_LOCUS214943 [marine metagenome]|uniref:Uncharacterized protein n=1 Tax=marine metagenome TaxID=408172 RepID=A0A382FHF4_9ZZZZ